MASFPLPHQGGGGKKSLLHQGEELKEIVSACFAETDVTTLRRFLVLAALIFWQGGFTFYAGVVVPVGRATIGAEQSIVTRRVTVFLNLAGAVALLLFAWDVYATSPRRNWRGAAWCAMTLVLPLLIWLHGRMDAVLDADTGSIQDHRVFFPLHRWYLWLSTAQWAFAVAFTFLSLCAWKEVDRLGG